MCSTSIELKLNGIWSIFSSLADCLLGTWFDRSFLLQLLGVSSRKPIAQLLPLEELLVGNLGFVFRAAAGRRGLSSGSGWRWSGAPLPRRDTGSSPSWPGDPGPWSGARLSCRGSGARRWWWRRPRGRSARLSPRGRPVPPGLAYQPGRGVPGNPSFLWDLSAFWFRVEDRYRTEFSPAPFTASLSFPRPFPKINWDPNDLDYFWEQTPFSPLNSAI